VRGTPVEINESVSPVVFWRKELRPGSGGHGRHRGGLGQVIEIESAIGEDFELLASFDRIIHPPRGRYGGHDGDRGGVRLASGAVLNGKGTQRIAVGERLILHTPGGAGFGDPHERDPAAVAADVAAGRISRETAKAVHGVDVAAG
jgi:N-methylhydantoinase B